MNVVTAADTSRLDSLGFCRSFRGRSVSAMSHCFGFLRARPAIIRLRTCPCPTPSCDARDAVALQACADMPESPSVTKGAGVAERQTQNTRNVRGASPCGFESHHPHAGLTTKAGRTYTRITLRVF